jgi:hypothetical protein
LVVFWSDRLHDFTRCTVPREVDPTLEFLDRNSEIGNLLRHRTLARRSDASKPKTSVNVDENEADR